MNEIIYYLQNCSWWAFLLSVFGTAIFIRCVYEILTGK